MPTLLEEISRFKAQGAPSAKSGSLLGDIGAFRYRGLSEPKFLESPDLLEPQSRTSVSSEAAAYAPDQSLLPDQAALARTKEARDILGEPTFVETALNSIDRAREAAGQGVAALPKGVALAAQQMDRLFGKDKDLKDYATWQMGEALSDYIAEKFQRDPRIDPTFLNETLPQAAGSTAPFLAGGMAAKALKGATTAAVALQGATVGGVQGYEEAKRFDKNDKAAEQSAGWNALLGLSEAAPIGRIFARYNKASGGVFKRQIVEGLKNGAFGSVEEGAQEIFQRVGGNAVAKNIYDEERTLVDGVLDSGGAGGVVGFVSNLIATLAGGRRARPAPSGIAPTSEAQAAIVAPVAPPTAETLLTPEGAASYAAAHPESARNIAKIKGDVNQRGHIRQTLVEGGPELGKLLDQEQRNTFRDLLKGQTDAEAESQKTVPTETAEEVPQAEGPVGDVLAKQGEAPKPPQTLAEWPQETYTLRQLLPQKLHERFASVLDTQVLKIKNWGTRGTFRVLDNEAAKEFESRGVSKVHIVLGENADAETLMEEALHALRYSLERPMDATSAEPSAKKGAKYFAAEIIQPPLAKPAPPAATGKRHVPGTFRAFVESKGVQWPIKVGTPEHAALLAEYQESTKTPIARKIDESEKRTGRKVTDNEMFAMTAGDSVDKVLGEFVPPDVPGQGVMPTSQEVVGAMARLPGIRLAVGKALKHQAGRLGGVPDAYLPNDPSVASRVVRAMRPDKTSWLAGKLKPLVALKNKLTRARESIPATGEMAVANDVFRKLEVQPGRMRSQAIDFMAEYSRPAANPDDISLLTLKLVAEDQRRGLSDPRGAQKLGYGLDPRALDVWIAKLNIEVAANPRVQAALQARNAAATDLVRKLVADGAPKEWLANVDAYWHRQVADYRDLEQRFGGGGKTLKKVKKPFTRARAPAEVPGVSEDEGYDPVANWVQAEGAWIKDAHQLLDASELRQQIEARYDILPALKATAEAQGVDWHEIIPAGNVRYVPEPGHTFYKAYTVGEKVAEGVQQLVYDDMGGLEPGQVREAVALGRPQFEWVIPEGIAEHLDSLAKKKPEGALGAAINSVHQKWKQWVTAVNPKRSLPYGLSNFFGDLDPVVAAIPSALSIDNFKTATRELWTDRVRHEGKSAALLRQLNNGVIGTGQTDIEVERLGRREDFDRLLPKEFSITAIPGNLARGYVDFQLAIHSFREDLLRSMVEREYLRKLNSGESVSYGGSKREVIDALRRDLGNEAASAKLTLDLVGNYQDRSAGVKWLSRYIAPFARWTDINLRREPRLLWNLMREAYEEGGAVGAAGAGVRRAAIRTPVTAVKTGLLAAKAVAGFSAMYTAGMLWNNFRYPELEKGLSEEDQSRPHLIIGVRSDGTPMLLRNFSALGAFADFLGIQKLAMLVPEYLQKKISGERLVQDVGWEVINNGVQLLGPQIKTPIELGTGKSYFPDIRYPRPSTAGETVSSVLGLRDEFKEIKGRLLKTGERSRPGRFMSPFPAGTDIRRTALTDAYAWRTRFLESIGKSSEFSGERSAFAVVRESGENADYEAFKEARQVYREGGGGRGYEDFLRHLRGMDPLSDRLSDPNERKFLNEYLRPDQVERVREARHYSKELEHRLWWWNRNLVMEEGTPEEQREYAKAVREQKQRLRQTIRSRPERQEGEKGAVFRERVQDKAMQRARAREELQMITVP